MPVITPVVQSNPGLTMPRQSYTLQLADPWTPVSDYTDITPLMMKWSGTVIGRQHELQLFQAGEVNLTLNNQDGRFSPWNTLGPYYNMLTPGDASCETVDGTANTVPAIDNWTGGTAVQCSVFQSKPSLLIDGPVSHVISIGANESTTVSAGDNGLSLATIISNNSLLVASTTGFAVSGFITVLCNTGGTPALSFAVFQYTTKIAGGSPAFQGLTLVEGTSTWTVSTGNNVTQQTTASTVTMPDNYYPVTAGKYYSIMCSFLADSSVVPLAQGATCGINVLWYTAAGSLISTSTSPTVTDNQASWTKASLLGVQAPATAAFAALQVTVTGNAGERHYFSRAALFNYVSSVPNTAWAPGQRQLGPARSVVATATWAGVTKPVFGMYVSNWTPKYGNVRALQTVALTDLMGLLALQDVSSSAYANQVLADGALSLWRLGDAISSLSAADSGPLNDSMLASNIVFGQTSPLLTDDTTVGLFQSSSTGPFGTLNSQTTLSSSAQTLEFLVMMPTQNATQATLFTCGDAYVAFTPNSITVNCHSTGVGVSAVIGCNNATLDDGSWHHVAVTCSAATNGTVNLYVDGVALAVTSGTATATGGGGSCLWTTGQPFFFGAGVYSPNGTYNNYNGSLGNIAYYNVALTPTQVANHYSLFSAGWAVQYSGQRVAEILTVMGLPASLQSISTGIQQVQGSTSSLTTQSVLSYLQTVATTEMGPLFANQAGVLTYYDRHYIITAPAATVSNATFGNSPNGGFYRFMPDIVPLVDDEDLWNDVPVQRVGGALQRSQSVLSQKQWTKRTLTGFTGELQTNDNDVLAQSQWLLAHYDQPYTRVREITLSSRTDAGANLVQMLGRNALDMITVNWLPTDGTTVSFIQAALIESITHTVTQDEWITTWGLSPAETAPYMILNDPIKGQLSTVNQLGY